MNSETTLGNDFTVGEDTMKNLRTWAGPAILALLLAAGGLGYAHLHLGSAFWILRVAVASIWRVAAGQFAASVLNAGTLLVPVALVTLVLAKAVGGNAKN
ncbi:MAG TPA: hypothetical protein VLW83_10720 [Candidatus Acidoferrales bacterium]|nr:hypothetical protein [Candidatus Acidoferrales bacterium]